MKVRVTRKTGFYGMGSPLKVLLNKNAFFINHDQTKEQDIPTASCSIQVSFYLLKSKVYHFHSQKEVLDLIIEMNPQMVQIYLAFFILMLFLPLMFRSLILSLILILFFFLFLWRFLQKAYVIKEVRNNNIGEENKNGQTS
ncbi:MULTISPECIES: hypothetical protein [Enterococcus]|uniref:hypothetical protein n=1 Tax=Enterococcus TaxID=1350 RepID=UPI00065E1B53|nr:MULTISPECIES: hypothetical protein [Enterococcus]KAF1302485.1 hypothetical protein BAU16_06615 [Enterococcus sp. JM9B]